MSYDFFAMLHRLRYIRRWGLMRNQIPENVQEHSHEVAALAHLLAVVRKRYFAEGRVCPDPATVALHGIFHDITEILTGDMPTPAKYFSHEMRRNYGVLENAAANHLLSMLPEDLKDEYRPLILDADGEEQKAIHELVKAADRLSALIKCRDEINAGNREFEHAHRYVSERLNELKLPEVEWFLTHVYPAYEKNLDELRGSINERL